MTCGGALRVVWCCVALRVRCVALRCVALRVALRVPLRIPLCVVLRCVACCVALRVALRGCCVLLAAWRSGNGKESQDK